MKVWRPSSLQWRLTLSLLAVTGLVWTLVLVMTWLKTGHELSELAEECGKEARSRSRSPPRVGAELEDAGRARSPSLG